MQMDIFDVLSPGETPVQHVDNNVLNVQISTPIALGVYDREHLTFNNVQEKEEHLSKLDVFSRRVSRTGDLEFVVVHVDLWK